MLLFFLSLLRIIENISSSPIFYSVKAEIALEAVSTFKAVFIPGHSHGGWGHRPVSDPLPEAKGWAGGAPGHPYC